MPAAPAGIITSHFAPVIVKVVNLENVIFLFIGVVK